MHKNIRRKFVAVFLTLAMVIGMLPAMQLKVSAADPPPYEATVNVPLPLKIAELSGLPNFEINSADYWYGFTRPTNGETTALLYFDNCGDIRDDEYLIDADDTNYSFCPLSNDDVINFVVGQNGTYTFVFKISVVDYATGNMSVNSTTITIHVTGGNNSPTFKGGATGNLTVNENSSDNDIKSLLHVSDSDVGQAMTWSQKTGPAHGTLHFSDATASSGGTDIAPGGTITYTPTAGFSGSDSFTVQVSDGIATASRTITVTIPDKTAPTGKITQGTNNWTSFWNNITFNHYFNNTVNITITAADVNGSGVKSIQYCKSATAYTELSQVEALTAWENYSSALSFTPEDAEKFVIYAKITDNADNVTYINSYGMVFDTQAPLIADNYTKDATTMEVTVTDSGSGVDTVAYTVNGGAAQNAALDANGKFTISSLAEGKYDVVVNARDKSSNESSHTINVVSLHTVTFKLFDGDPGDAVSTQTVEYGNGAAAPATPARAGFAFKSWDKSYSSITADTTVNATWDISGIIVTPYSDIFDGTAHDAVTVTGMLAGDVVTYSTDGTHFASSCPKYTDAGSYPVYVKVERNGCTAWESGLKTAAVSRAGGSVTITGDPSKAYDGSAVLNPAIEKNGSGAVAYTYYNDNGGVIGTVPLPDAPSAIGIYWVKAAVAQDANYYAAETTRKFTISLANITGSVSIPSVILTGSTVTASVAGALPAGVTFDYEWRLDDMPTGMVGSIYTVSQADYGKTLTVVLNATGNYTGSITSNGVKISEAVAPTGTITQGINNWTSFWNSVTFNHFFKETVDVTITAEDAGGSGVKSIQYCKSATAYTELSQVEALTAWENYSSALSFTPEDAEKFVIYAKITDNADNVTYINSYGMVFDTQAPLIADNYTKDATTMEVTVTDSGSGVDTVAYTVNGGAAQNAALDANGKFTISSLAEGKYDVVVNARDKSSNESSHTINVVSLHTVTFKLFDGDPGDAVSTQTVEYGNGAAAPATPARAGFAFKSWDKSYSSITADTTVNATWDISGIIVTPYSDIFDGTAHDAVTVTGMLASDVVTYSTDGIHFAPSCPQYTDAGSYPAYVKVERSDCTAWESGMKTAVIDRKAITADMIANIPSAEYTAAPIIPLPEVTYGTIILKNGADYTVSYTNNTNIGLAAVNIDGKGNYSGGVSKPFAIYAKNTSVEIKDKQTPPVLAEGLETIYKDKTVYTPEDQQIEQNGGTVKIKLSVQLKTDIATDRTKIGEVAADKTIGLYLDLSLFKTVTLTGEGSGTTTAISHLNHLLTIVVPIPDSIKGKEGIAMYRVHQGIASVIPVGESNAVDGEYCTIGTDTITLYVKNFSTYAIGYNSPISGGNTTVGGNTANGSNAAGDNNNPSSGDTIPVLPVAGMLAGLMVLLFCGCVRKKKTRN